MSMYAVTVDNPADTDGIINQSSGDKINKTPTAGSMGVGGIQKNVP